MELVKNRVSGKSFIVLDDTEAAYFLLITPEGKVKRLKRHLFEPQLAPNHKVSQWHCRLTKEQMDRYSEYEEFVNY